MVVLLIKKQIKEGLLDEAETNLFPSGRKLFLEKTVEGQIRKEGSIYNHEMYEGFDKIKLCILLVLIK